LVLPAFASVSADFRLGFAWVSGLHHVCVIAPTASGPVRSG
jgi:hypothetical protein